MLPKVEEGDEMQLEAEDANKEPPFTLATVRIDALESLPRVTTLQLPLWFLTEAC